jgi:hypothetical protein
MEICKNRKTGAVFVYLDEQEDGRALLISPQGNVKALEYQLFTELNEVDEELDTLISQNRITDIQLDIYKQYFK